MKKIIGPSFKTSIIGFVLIISSIVTVFLKISTWTEAIIGITAGIGLFVSKDHDA